MAVDSADRREFVVKIDGGNSPATTSTPSNSNANASTIWRESSYEFWNDKDKKQATGLGGGGAEEDGFDFGRGGQEMESPPSKLIGQFLHKQKASGEIALDMDLDMDELKQHGPRGLPPVSESPASAVSAAKLVSDSPSANRVSFDTANSNVELVRRRQQKESPAKDGNNSSNNNENGEVVKCTSNKSFHRTTQSRLLDPPAPLRPADMKSGKVSKSAQIRSGFLGKAGAGAVEEEEEDPLLEEDLPEEYKKDKLSVWVLLEWVSLILIIAALVCSLTIPFLRGKKLWKLGLWKWEVMILVLICGRLVSSWIVRIVVFFIERNFLLRKRVLYFVYGVRKAVMNCLWLGLVLIAWHFLFDKKVERETRSTTLRYVTNVLVCLLVGVLLWLVKTLLVKVLASSFHVSTYFDRIQESLFNQYAIETLSGPPLVEIRKIEEEEQRIANEVKNMQDAGVTISPRLKATACPSPQNTKVMGSGLLQGTPRSGKSPRLSRVPSNAGNDQGITIDHLHKLNPKNVSAWNMKRLMNIIRHGSLSTLDEQIQDSAHYDESATQIRSEYEAKLAARKIFQNVAKPGSKYIYLEDIMRFMQEDEAQRTMNLFEGATDSRRISKSSLKNWVVNAFRERRALALTLNDTKTAVNKLHRMVNVLVGIIIVIIWLLILGIATTKFLLLVSSQLLLVVFVFGNTCKTIFEAIIFLFVIHPFDVGDRCEIDGVQMVVEEMNILTTVFLRFDNQKIIFPNSVLATKAINNYHRSPDMGDGIEFCIHISTPAEKIAAMKQRIVSYVENKKEHWYPAPMIIFKEMEELNRVRMALWLTHRMNHQDMGERWARRGLLLEEMAKIFRELDIQYRLFPIDINVRAMPPVMSDRLPPNWTAPSS